jgi:uncharacterized protein YndB with AHSA1/START domain
MSHHENPELRITRVFDAPREVIWRYWTDPEYYRRWQGPKGFTDCGSRIDVRVGGEHLTCFLSLDGQKLWSTGVYEEVVAPERLVITDSFADERGNVVPATYYGMGADYPLVARIVVTFEESAGKTKMTIRHEGVPAGTIDDMTTGWNESLDKIDSDLLAMAERR